MYLHVHNMSLLGYSCGFLECASACLMWLNGVVSMLNGSMLVLNGF